MPATWRRYAAYFGPSRTIVSLDMRRRGNVEDAHARQQVRVSPPVKFFVTVTRETERESGSGRKAKVKNSERSRDVPVLPTIPVRVQVAK